MPGLVVNGIDTFASAALNEQQREAANFALLVLQKHSDTVDVQVPLFARNNYLHFSPDLLGDLLFNGIAQTATRSDFAAGLQADGSWRAADEHTIRGGVQVQGERATFRTTSSVLPADADATPTSDTSFDIGQSGGKTGWLYGMYLQDEWRVRPTLTINYGARFDLVDAFSRESQISPRINVVWRATPSTTLHAGYARYFAPPALQAVSQTDIAAFQGTTAAPLVTQNDPVKAERSHDFDIGITQKLLPGLQIGLDAYYKKATNEGDVGQFGAPIILTPFSYAKAKIYGGEVSASYESGPWSLYANLGWAKSQATGISSAQFNFAPDELAYIDSHWIYVDHDQRWTGSAGIAYTADRDTAHPTLVSVDVLAGSGLRASTATVPNGTTLPGYEVINFSIAQNLALGLGSGTELRLDVLNLTDRIYQIRNGTGVSVGASQYGLRRTILAGVTQRF